MKIFLTVLLLISGTALASADERWFLDEHIFAKRIDDSSPVYVKNRYRPVTRQKLLEYLPLISKFDDAGKNHLVYLADYKIPEHALPECTPQAIEFGTENAGFFGLSGWLNAPSVIHLPSTRVYPIPGRIDASNSFIHFDQHKKLSLNSSSDYYDACPDYLIRWFEIFTSDAQQQPPADQNEPGTELLSAGSHFFDFKNDRKRPGRGFLLDDFEIILMSAQQFFLTQELSDDDNNLPLDFDQMVVQIINPDGESERVYLHEPEWNEFISTLTGSTSQPLDDSLLPREAIIYSRRDIMNADLLLEAFAENTKDASTVPGIHQWGGDPPTRKRENSQQAPSSSASALTQSGVPPQKKAHISPQREDDNPWDEQQLSCVFCGRAFLSSQDLEAHLKGQDFSEFHPAKKESASALAKQIIPTTTEPEWMQFFSPETQSQLTNLLGGTNPAYWEPQGFVNTLIERTHDDLASRYAEAATTALAENNPMPVPGMHFTVEKMLERIEFFLLHSWLSEQDQGALKAFREELQVLQREGYPYFRSIEKSIAFSFIQQMFYFLARPHVWEWRDTIDKSGTSRLHEYYDKHNISRIESISQVVALPWQMIFESENIPAARELVRHLYAFTAKPGWSLFDQPSIDKSLFRVHSYRNKVLFSISFAELGVPSLNLMANLSIAPIRLSEAASTFHDNEHMSSSRFTWQDVTCFARTTSHTLTDDKQHNQEMYERVRLFYESKNKLAVETFHVTERLLYYFLHERVAPAESSYIITREIQFRQILEAIWVPTHAVACWADLPEDHLKWLRSDEILKGIIALQAIHKGEAIEQRDIDTAFDQLKTKITAFSDIVKKAPDTEQLADYSFDCNHLDAQRIRSSIKQLIDTPWERLYNRDKIRIFALFMFPEQIPSVTQEPSLTTGVDHMKNYGIDLNALITRLSSISIKIDTINNENISDNLVFDFRCGFNICR